MLDKFYLGAMYQLGVFKNKVNDFFKSEKGGSEMIAVVIMIGIVVVLALIFKNKIVELINKIFDNADKNVDAVLSPIE